MPDLSFLPEKLIPWFEQNGRPLPWRADPSPYHVWISEIMLQQTRIEAAIATYERFLAALPDIPALAEVREEDLLKLWEGLGYYSRARNLQKAARVIVERFGGNMPSSRRELLDLPGVGDYTAGAIASIAFLRPEPAVDGNVVRVLARLLALPLDGGDPKTRKTAREWLLPLYRPGESARSLTEGLMELGEVLCLPNGAPRCALCPLQARCRAFAEEAQSAYPLPRKKKERRVEEWTVLICRREGRVALQKRPDSGLLAGLWQFPMLPGFVPADSLPGAQSLGPAKHLFSHVEWRMQGYELSEPPDLPGLVWASPQELETRYALPSAFRPYLPAALTSPGDRGKMVKKGKD